LGWRTNLPERLNLPPKDFGTGGEWVEVGPEAELLAFAPPEWVADSGEMQLRDFTLGRVLIDGAQTPVFALLRLDNARDELKRGARLIVRFADAQVSPSPDADFWFEPIVGVIANGSKV